MTAPNPLVVATLPGRTVEDVRHEVELAREGGADLAEVRLDRWSEVERRRMAHLFPSNLPLIATLRSRAEGGQGPDSASERTASLLGIAQLPFRWIDLETARDGHLIDRLPPSTSLGRILSSHLPADTPTDSVLGPFREPTTAGTVHKVVVPASVATVLSELLPRLRVTHGGPHLLLTTGASGGLLRAWSKRLAFPLVFASLPASGPGVAPEPVESSQIPCDRLRFFFDADSAAPVFAVLGHPVQHSLSPYLHSRWMRAQGVRGLYIPLDISSEAEFVECLGPLADGGFRGLNVTAPWKSAALESATQVSPGARRCGAANCLTFRAGEIEAENTDLVAVLRRLEEFRAAGQWDGEEVVVVGSGGAAAATLAAAQELGANAWVLARRAAPLVGLTSRFGAKSLPPGDARPFPLVVHATPVGRAGTGPLDAPLKELIGPATQLLDWVYSPSEPTVRATVEAAGGRYEDGWRLLVYQAAASFAIWWGEEPTAEELESTMAEGPCTA
jgi:shikimate dehydrogenase/3-dehydroquinate dehydratase type I